MKKFLYLVLLSFTSCIIQAMDTDTWYPIDPKYYEQKATTLSQGFLAIASGNTDTYFWLNLDPQKTIKNNPNESVLIWMDRKSGGPSTPAIKLDQDKIVPNFTFVGNTNDKSVRDLPTGLYFWKADLDKNLNDAETFKNIFSKDIAETGFKPYGGSQRIYPLRPTYNGKAFCYDVWFVDPLEPDIRGHYSGFKKFEPTSLPDLSLLAPTFPHQPGGDPVIHPAVEPEKKFGTDTNLNQIEALARLDMDLKTLVQKVDLSKKQMENEWVGSSDSVLQDFLKTWQRDV